MEVLSGILIAFLFLAFAFGALWAVIAVAGSLLSGPGRTEKAVLAAVLGFFLFGRS